MSKSASIALFSVATILFFAVVGFTFRDIDIQHLIDVVSINGLLEMLGLGFFFHLSFGLIMWVGFLLHYKLRIKSIDILTIPMMMHLFLYLMPIKGGMLFQVFYSKHKYDLDLSKGFSLGIMVFLNSIVITVLLGLGLAYLIPVESFELRITILAMGVGLIGTMTAMNFLPAKLKEGSGIVVSLVNFLINVRIQLVEQFKNAKLFFGLLITSTISVLIQAFWFWKTSEILGIPSEFAPVCLVVLILRIILLFRVLPGNLGVQELMIGVVFAAAGFELDDGLLIGVVTRLVSVFWSAAIGLPALYSNLKYFDSLSLRGLIDKVAKSSA